MKRLIDTSGWVEYFLGTNSGKKIKEIIENEEVYMSSMTFAEISKWVQINNLDLDLILEKIKSSSVVIHPDEGILVQSGKIYLDLRKLRNKISLIDAIIYTTSIANGINLVTKDNDFRNLVSVEMI